MVDQIALVGIGKIARDQHIPAIAATECFTLGATASRNPEAVVDGVPAYQSLDALLAGEPDISAVSLATPPQARFADAALALRQGKHVMLEKPPGATLSEVHALAAIAEAAGVSLYATWHSREAAAVDAARDWLAGRSLTKLEIRWFEDVREWHPGQDWIWEAGGLGVFDPGINALSILTTILPEPVHLKAAELLFPKNRDAPIAANLTFSGLKDAALSARFDWRAEVKAEWVIEMETTDGRAVLSKGGACFDAEGALSVDGSDQEYARLYNRFGTLIAQRASDVDLAPMRHVADAFTLGRRREVAPFDW